MTLTDDEIKTIAARAEAATAEPWSAFAYEAVAGILWNVERVYQDGSGTALGPTIIRTEPEDAQFIAASRSDVPALCAELLAARAEIAARIAEDKIYVAENQVLLDVLSEGRRTAEHERDEAQAEIARLGKALQTRLEISDQIEREASERATTATQAMTRALQSMMDVERERDAYRAALVEVLGRLRSALHMPDASMALHAWAEGWALNPARDLFPETKAMKASLRAAQALLAGGEGEAK